MNVTDRTLVAAAGVRATAGRPAPSSVWIKHLALLSALVALLGLFNAQTIATAVDVWWISPTFSHCFFVIPVSAYFVWRRRHIFAGLTPAAYPLALWLLPPLVLFSLIGRLAHINEAEQLAFIALVQVLILAVLGPLIYRKLLFPCLFLFFLVPMGEYLINPLQYFTTRFISAGLTLLGIPHYTEVNLIQLSTGDYEVAEACAGLRFLIATIAVSALFTNMMYRKWYKVVLFLAASLIVPAIANGFRALGIVLLGYWSDNRIAHGADHLIYGWGFLVAILTLMMFVGMRYADPAPKEEHAETVVAPPQRLQHALALTVLLSLAAISVTPAVVYGLDHRPSHIDKAAFSTPLRPAGWQTSVVAGGWSPQYPTPDARLDFAMRKTDAAAVDVFVNYYKGGNESHSLVSSTNRLWAEDVWHPLSHGTAEAQLGGRTVHLGESVISAAGVTRIIWWTYWSGGRFTTNAVAVKLDRLRQALMGGRGSALLAVSTPVEVDSSAARARLRQALHALGPLESRLKEAGRS